MNNTLQCQILCLFAEQRKPKQTTMESHLPDGDGQREKNVPGVNVEIKGLLWGRVPDKRD